MKRRRRKPPKIDIIKVLICFILLIFIGVGTKVLIDQQKISQPAANASVNVAEGAATTSPSSTESGETENPTLDKTTAYVAPGSTLALKVKDTTQTVQWSSSDETIATVSDDGTVTGVAKGDATIIATVGDKELTCDITVKKLKQVAITFDDGPCEYTPEVLDILEKYNAHATFFVIGERINSTTSKYLKREVEMGCEVGNHTHSHVDLARVSLSTFKQEIAKGNKAIKDATGKEPTLIRPPYGDITPERKKMIEQTQIYWNKDTRDWDDKDTEKLVNYVLNNTQDGDIVLMHEIHKTTVDGVERIVKGLQDQGFELLTIDEIADSRNIKLSKYKLHGSF